MEALRPNSFRRSIKYGNTSYPMKNRLRMKNIGVNRNAREKATCQKMRMKKEKPLLQTIFFMVLGNLIKLHLGNVKVPFKVFWFIGWCRKSILLPRYIKGTVCRSPKFKMNNNQKQNGYSLVWCKPINLKSMPIFCRWVCLFL